ncbi:hypothetical protein SAMN05216525_107100 [Bradyrhizobium sp. Gha]|nr:hypothetical protein SAMN05216525_107100 [Bradyrhizobium sp. Gha]
MDGPAILVRTLSKTNVSDRYQNSWQYHSRSDRHSKIACWGVIFDLLASTPLLKRHVESGTVCFGINHEMRDFVHDRKKNLDLVLCTPGGPATSETLANIAAEYGIHLTPEERATVREASEACARSSRLRVNGPGSQGLHDGSSTSSSPSIRRAELVPSDRARSKRRGDSGCLHDGERRGDLSQSGSEQEEQII